MFHLCRPRLRYDGEGKTCLSSAGFDMHRQAVQVQVAINRELSIRVMETFNGIDLSYVDM